MNTVEQKASGLVISDKDGDTLSVSQPTSAKWPRLYFQVNGDNVEADLAHLYVDIAGAKALVAELERFIVGYGK